AAGDPDVGDRDLGAVRRGKAAGLNPDDAGSLDHYDRAPGAALRHRRTHAERGWRTSGQTSTSAFSFARSFWFALRIALTIMGVATLANPEGSPRFRKVMRVDVGLMEENV